MKGQWHINPKSRSLGRCSAEKGECPFEKDNPNFQHFDTMEEAKAGYEEFMSEYKMKTHRKQTYETSPQAKKVQEIEQMIRNNTKERTQIDSLIKKNLAQNEQFENTTQYYNMVQHRKQLFYDGLVLKKNRLEALPKDIADQEIQDERNKEIDKQKRRDDWFNDLKARGDYSYHPEVEDALPRYQESLRSTFVALSNMNEQELDNRINELKNSGMSTREAYRKLWKDTPLNENKYIMSLDLETSSEGMDATGEYSNIIEVGYVKYDPRTGKATKHKSMFGIPENAMSTVGTGAVDVHKITPEMIEGLTPFNKNGDEQKQLIHDLNNSVLVAHNSVFEKAQLSNNLYRFNENLSNGNIEVADSKMVPMFLMENEPVDNTNKSFVEGTGGAYVDAHRALNDAEMTLNALLRSKGLPEFIEE